VALVQNLPERDLGVARDVDILRAVADKLHQTTSHFVFMLYCKKKIFVGQMNVLLWPTANPILNTFLRSIVLILGMIFGFGQSLYSAYWGAVVHDAISLWIIRDMV
jgi:hypothetical protein